MIQNSRRTYLDLLRIIACFLVIFNHLRGYLAYQQSQNVIQSFYYMGYTMLTRINVPIFFMISGSLLLSKEHTYKDLFFKRIARIAIALLCASFVIYLINIRGNPSSFNVVVFLGKLLKGTHSGAYWYLYAYLGFLLTVPFLRKIAKQLDFADYILLLALHFVFATLLPLFNYVIIQYGISEISVSGDFSVPLMTSKAFFYPLVGYYIDQVFDIKKLNSKNVWILPGIILLGIVISSAFTYHQGIHSGYTQQFVQTFDYTTAISVFLLLKYLFVNVSVIRDCSMLNRVICFLGSLTFGMYLMDPALKVFESIFASVVTTQDPILYSFIWCLFSMIVCGILTFGLKKIPLIKKLL